MSKADSQQKRRSPGKRLPPVAAAAAGALVLLPDAPVHCSGDAVRGVLENCKSLLLERLGSRPDTIACVFLSGTDQGDQAIATILAQVEVIRADLDNNGSYQFAADGLHLWLQRLPATWYGRPVDQKQEAFRTAERSLDALAELRSYSLGQGADWDRLMALLRNVVRAMEGGDEQPDSGQASPALVARRMAELRSEVESAEVIRQTRIVFGDRRPSAEGLADYLSSLTQHTSFTLAERKAVVTTVNFWKKQLVLQLRYKRRRCNLSYVTNEFEGLFVLREPGRDGGYLYNQSAFPPLKIAPATKRRSRKSS